MTDRTLYRGLLVPIVMLLLTQTRVAYAGKANGEVCGSAAECTSGFCVDGVCCVSQCADYACQACNLSGSEGHCMFLRAGPQPPVGGRTCKEALPASVAKGCGVYQCNGNPFCDLFYKPGVTCAAAKCDGTTFVSASKCKDDGSCPPSTPEDCSPFKCAPTGCLRTCASDAECAGGFSCVANNCVSVDARCSDDGLSSLDRSNNVTPCAPFRCGDAGHCFGACTNSVQCVPGAVCDPATGKCVGSTPASTDDGGCSVGRVSPLTREAEPGAALALFGLVVLAATRRGRSS